MLHQQRPHAPPSRPTAGAKPADAVVVRPRSEHAAVAPPRSTQTLNARGDLARAGKVRSPVA